MTMYKTLVMTILALVGVFCYHKKIVDQEMNKKLSELEFIHTSPALYIISERLFKRAGNRADDIGSVISYCFFSDLVYLQMGRPKIG